MTEPHFNGEGYENNADHARLTGQVKRVFNCMRDCAWRTLPEIELITGDPQASISAQLRHLRKDRFGAHTINKRRRGTPTSGLWEYQLVERSTPKESIPTRIDDKGQVTLLV